jgi:hypothetical protein
MITHHSIINVSNILYSSFIRPMDPQEDADTITYRKGRFSTSQPLIRGRYESSHFIPHDPIVLSFLSDGMNKFASTHSSPASQVTKP